ncbi:hypothetical protein BCV71DRAFT_238421 [Rhizopus microsporus]|uniref:Uncharacterized protein n=1 Tax=Rhizopus microsporus TaxID=58291 RepID=A0A1X0RQY0_RHIZD|nr:hypothetical protein BCV71DRAFT_238421 [Rhizopus microsporus]
MIAQENVSSDQQKMVDVQVLVFPDIEFWKERSTPNHYLLTCELFSNSLYKAFEDQLLASLQEGDAAFTPSQRATRAITELISSLYSGFSSITSTMLTIHKLQASSRYSS